MSTAGQMEGKVAFPQRTVTYTFEVPALGKVDYPCKIETYKSAVDIVKDINTGLIGPLLLCQKRQLVSIDLVVGCFHVFI